jgi:hypothetical protein
MVEREKSKAYAKSAEQQQRAKTWLPRTRRPKGRRWNRSRRLRAAQSQVGQTMQKASDKSDAAMGKVDSTVDSLLGK